MKTTAHPGLMMILSKWMRNCFAVLMCGISASCQQQKPSQNQPVQAPLEWPASIPMPAQMKLEGEIPWTIADGPFFSSTFDRIVDEDPPPGRAQSMQDLATKTILLVGNPAEESPVIEGTFQKQGYHEIIAENAEAMRQALLQFQIDLVVIQSSAAEERAECGRIMMEQFPRITFTTFQPEKGQKDLSMEARALLGEPARETAGILGARNIRRAFREGELVGLGPGDESLPMMALRPRVKKRERRMEAFRALTDWVKYAPGNSLVDSRPGS